MRRYLSQENSAFIWSGENLFDGQDKDNTINLGRCTASSVINDHWLKSELAWHSSNIYSYKWGLYWMITWNFDIVEDLNLW